jgi:hypothetical protein
VRYRINFMRGIMFTLSLALLGPATAGWASGRIRIRPLIPDRLTFCAGNEFNTYVRGHP